MEPSFEKSAVVLLLIAAVVAMITRRLRLPYSVALVATGMILALLPFSPHVNLTKDLIFGALLPPLVFEAALYLNWHELRRDLVLILVLATLGVVISAAITAAAMHSVAAWPWESAVIFGILIAATDPVSVIATFREAGVQGRLRLLVESESLFNDGTAAVGFAVALSFFSGQPMTIFQTVGQLALVIGGGVFCGAAVAVVILGLSGRTEDHLVELTFTTVAAYGSFLLAESLGVSGVLAALTAGLMLGNLGPLGAFSDRGREAVQAFWEYAAFLSNSLIFLLIGMELSKQNFVAIRVPVVAGIVFVILGRAATVYPICLAFSRTKLRVSAAHQHVLFWGGLRGALALALALALPPDMPGRADVETVSFAVVAFSVFAQGLSVAPLLRRLKQIPHTES